MEKSNICSLGSLFNALPNLMVIELNLDHSTVQLIRSGQYNPTDITSLVAMLEGNNNNFPEVLATIQSG